MMSNNGGNSAEWRTVGSKNKGNEEGLQAGTNSGENGGSPMQVKAMTLENGENSGRTNATVANDANAADGMKTYNTKTGFIEVIFVTGKSKAFNVARALKQFLAAAREQDNEFTILPLSGIGNKFCISADVPNTKDGIEQYFCHEVKFNNVNGKLRIRASKDISGSYSAEGKKFEVISKIREITLTKHN
jgi:hypothetical protein